MATVTQEEQETIAAELRELHEMLRNEDDVPDKAFTIRQYAEANNITYDAANNFLASNEEDGLLLSGYRYAANERGAEVRTKHFWQV